MKGAIYTSQQLRSVILVFFLVIAFSSPSELVAAFRSMTPVQQNASRLVFEFSEVIKPTGDTRELAVAFHSINFLGSNANSKGDLLFGTPEANALQDEGWYANEHLPDIGFIQWAGGPSKRASMQLSIPVGTESLLLNITSIIDGLWMNVTVDGQLKATLKVDAYWHSGYVPIADTPTIPPVGKPEWVEGHYFPRFPPTDRIYAIHVRSLLEDWWGRPSDIDFRTNESYDMMMALTLVGMQGVINRNGSSVYLDWVGSSSWCWIPLLRQHVEVVYLDLDSLSAINFLFRRFYPRFAGAVIYDPNMPDTINLATMLAGLENRIILAPEQIGLPGIPKFSSVTDLRLLVDEQGWDATLDGQYQLYKWVYDNLWPRLEHRIIGVLSSGPPTSRTIDSSDSWPLGMASRDYIVALRLATLWLSPSEEPQKSLFAKFLEDSPSPIPIYGFFSGEEINTVAFAASHGDWVPVIYNPNTPLGCADLSVFGAIRPDLKSYQMEVDTDRLFSTLGKKPVATIWSSDGDSLQYQMDRGFFGMTDFVWDFVQGNRFGWTINPTMMDLTPLIWNHYVESGSEVSLLSGFSGAGYTYPGFMNATQLRAYLSRASSYLKETGLRVIHVDDRLISYSIPWESLASNYYEYLKDAGYLGAFVGGWGPRWGLWFEYAGVPTPGVRPNYTINATNGAWIIGDLLTRKSDKVFLDMVPYPWQDGSVVQDSIADRGKAVLFSSDRSIGSIDGPFITLAPGTYRLTFRMKVSDDRPTDTIAHIHVDLMKGWDWSTSHVIAERYISPNDFEQVDQYQNFTLSFTLDQITPQVEFRMTYYNKADLYVDYVEAARESSLGIPVFASIFIPLAGGQHMSETLRFINDFEQAEGIILHPDQFIAALNPEFMLEWATPILGSEHPALSRARGQLNAGDFLGSLLTVRQALRILPERTYLIEDAGVAVRGNTWVTDLSFDPRNRVVSFLAHGPPEGTVTASIMIPNDLLVGPFLVYVDGQPRAFMRYQNDTHTALALELTQGPHQVQATEPWILIDDAWVSDGRADVGSVQRVRLHSRWRHNESSVTTGTIYVNGQPYHPDEDGWIVVQHSRQQTGESVWTVTGVDVGGVANFQQTVSDLQVIWDKVTIDLSAVDDMVEAGTSVSVDCTAVYQYDGTGFEGTIALNDTLTKSTVGTYHYTAKEIRDNRYGITAFDCNTLAITFVDTTAPAANAGPDQTVEEDTPVSFDGTESSDIVGITSYAWTFTDVTLQTLTGEKPTYSFATPGTYTVTLGVADDAGNSASDTFVITVLDITNPVANAGVDRTTAAGASVSLDAGGSADNVGITSYEWSLGDGNSKSGKTIEHTYAKPGTYTVTLTAKDAAGNFAKDTVMVRVDDITPPVADAGSDRTVKVGEAVTFDARGSTDDVGVTSYEWDFGDGNTGTGITAIHTYEEAGTYAVALTVKDAAGNTKMDTATVTVAAEPRFSWIIPGIGAVIVAALAVLYLVVARRRSQKISTY